MALCFTQISDNFNERFKHFFSCEVYNASFDLRLLFRPHWVTFINPFDFICPLWYQTNNIHTIHHHSDVIMRAIASQITSLTIVYSIVYSDVNQRKHQSPASLAFVRGIHRGPVNSPHKWPVTRKMFPFDDAIMYNTKIHNNTDNTKPLDNVNVCVQYITSSTPCIFHEGSNTPPHIRHKVIEFCICIHIGKFILLVSCFRI